MPQPVHNPFLHFGTEKGVYDITRNTSRPQAPNAAY